MVSTQDSESCDPSSNLGGTCDLFRVPGDAVDALPGLPLRVFICNFVKLVRELLVCRPHAGCTSRCRDSSVGRALD